MQNARGPQLPGSPASSSLLSGGEGADDAPRQTHGGKSLLQGMGARTAQEPSGAGIGTAAPGAEARVVPARIPGSEHKGIGRAFAARLGRRRPRSKIGEGVASGRAGADRPLPARKKEGGNQCVKYRGMGLAEDPLDCGVGRRKRAGGGKVRWVQNPSRGGWCRHRNVGGGFCPHSSSHSSPGFSPIHLSLPGWVSPPPPLVTWLTFYL